MIVNYEQIKKKYVYGKSRIQDLKWDNFQYLETHRVK